MIIYLVTYILAQSLFFTLIPNKAPTSPVFGFSTSKPSLQGNFWRQVFFETLPTEVFISGCLQVCSHESQKIWFKVLGKLKIGFRPNIVPQNQM